jgi:hypothetical protein
MLYIVGAIVLLVGFILGNPIVKIAGTVILGLSAVLHMLMWRVLRSREQAAAKEEEWQRRMDRVLTSYAPSESAGSSSSISAEPKIDFSRFGRR